MPKLLMSTPDEIKDNRMPDLMTRFYTIANTKERWEVVERVTEIKGQKYQFFVRLRMTLDHEQILLVPMADLKKTFQFEHLLVKEPDDGTGNPTISSVK